MITNLNAHALMNSANALINTLLNNKKATINGVITEWNVCVDQSGFTTMFDFPTTGYTRKAQVIADLERCANQLKEMAFAPVEKLIEVEVQDIEVGMWVKNPLVDGQFQQVEQKAQYGEYVVIQFSWNMDVQNFHVGETLMIKEQDMSIFTTIDRLTVGDVFVVEVNGVVLGGWIGEETNTYVSAIDGADGSVFAEQITTETRVMVIANDASTRAEFDSALRWIGSVLPSAFPRYAEGVMTRMIREQEAHA